ncbi:MAG: NAD(P)/FAD-dependent oxidoreductase [Chloroflexota bacterium]
MTHATGKPDAINLVVAGAGYAGLHIALRLGTWLGRHPNVDCTLVDQHDYHQVLTELPRVVAGSRPEGELRVPLDTVLSSHVHFALRPITGFDLAGKQLLTEAGPLPYTWLVLALGSRPNDFDIPGLAEHVLYLWSVEDAARVWAAVNASVEKAGSEPDEVERRRLLTVVIGGGGATGVELAGGLAEEMPALARAHGLDTDEVQVIIVEAGPTILAGSSPQLIGNATDLLARLGVRVCTNSMIAQATENSFTLKNGEAIRGGVFIWAGGVKAPELISGSGLPVGYNGRIKVDQYLRALDHPNIFVAGDLASVVDSETGRALPPLAQIAIDEGESVAHNLQAAIVERPLSPFHFHDKGFVLSVGKRGVVEAAGIELHGRLAHTLKDAIEWEYRQSVKHLRGWASL